LEQVAGVAAVFGEDAVITATAYMVPMALAAIGTTEYLKTVAMDGVVVTTQQESVVVVALAEIFVVIVALSTIKVVLVDREAEALYLFGATVHPPVASHLHK
jgi:hypothetical protein